MFSNLRIKICGIQDASMAAQTVAAGAHFIGIVFHPASVRHVDVARAALISRATKQAGGIPVAVFVDQRDKEMRTICETTDIQTVQLHGDNARNHHHLLPAFYQRIYVLHVNAEGMLQTDAGLTALDQTRDMILIDHMQPGEGRRFRLDNFHYPFALPWILAGGLTPENVTTAVDALCPNGVDVSTGVEISKGQKDIFLIQQFIKNLRGHNESHKYNAK